MSLWASDLFLKRQLHVSPFLKCAINIAKIVVSCEVTTGFSICVVVVREKGVQRKEMQITCLP